MAPASPVILIVDDEPQLRLLMRLFLERDHYTVVEADTVEHAIGVICGTPLDLVIVDLILPDGDGRDVVQAIRALHPQTPVLVTSGYPGLSESVAHELGGRVDFLDKPFTSVGLLRQVRKLVRSVGPTA